MRIKRIELEKFRKHAHTIMNISAPFVVIRGLNWAGKSSIAEAISMGLTPSTKSLPTDGKGFTKKIQRGESKAVITLDIQGGKHLVRQVVTLNTNTTGRTALCTCLDDEDWKPLPFEKILKDKKNALLIACNTDHFLHSKMSEDDQKNLMASLVLPSHYDFPKDKIDAVEKALGEGVINFDEEPFAVIAKAYKKLYEERQNVNRQVKEIIIPDPLPMTSGVDSESLQAQLGTYRDARQRVLDEKDAATKKESERDKERTRIEVKLEELQISISKDREELSKITLLSESKVKELTKISEKKTHWDQLIVARNELLVKIKEYKHQAQHWSKEPETQMDCPTCGQVITKEYIASTKHYYEEVLRNAIRDDDEIMAALKAMGDVDGAIADIATHEEGKKKQREINQAIAEKEKNYQLGKEKLAKMGTKVDINAQFEGALKAADQEIEAITAQLRPVITAEERAKEIVFLTEKLEKKRSQAAVLDSLVKYFDKDGIKATLLSEHIGSFENKINEVMSAFNYKCTLSIEPYQFLVTDAAGVTNPVSELSGAEERIFAAAFQCAVSRAAGLGVAVIDEVDRLLPEIRPTLFKALYLLVNQKIMEQVILIVADSKKEVPTMPDAEFFFVEAGSVYRLE